MHSKPPDIALVTARKYLKFMKIIALFFVLGVAALVPFLDDNPLNRYWRPFGQVIVLAVGGLWLALIFTGGMAFIHCQAHRETEGHDHSAQANGGQ